MIKLVRGEVPPFFASPRIQTLRAAAATFFGQAPSVRAQKKFDFQRFASMTYPAIRAILKQRFPAKCAYCETPLQTIQTESFRPKVGAVDLNGKTDDDHYWWLAFEWSNYLPACRSCNALKGARFPVLGGRARVGATGAELAAEGRLLLNPCDDEPTQLLLFLDDGRVTSEDERGRVTIDVLGLNRSALVAARYDDLRNLIALLEKKTRTTDALSRAIDRLTTMTADQSPFAGMRRQYVRAWAIEASNASPQIEKLTPQLRNRETALAGGLAAQYESLNKASVGLSERTRTAEAYSVDAARISPSFYRQTRFIERIEFTNIRGFERLELRPPIGVSDQGEWFVLLGENGTGKSSVLQAIACALSGQNGVSRLGVVSSDLLRRGCTHGEVRIHVTGMSEPVVMALSRRPSRITISPPEPKLMVLGYGATRLLTQKGVAAKVRLNVQNLFDPYARLSNGRPWLYKAGNSEFDRIARSLSALLPRSDGAHFTRRAGQIYVEMPGVRDTLTNLSSGYQAVIALALDIISVMRVAWDDMESAEGIVLIDEIDAHLHPRWKMRIVRRLREVFPRMQFIATSHEPLTLRGLERSEVGVLKRLLDGGVTAITAETDDDFPSPKLLRVDQLLTSELFGLHSSEDLEVDALFEEYYSLLASRKRSRGDEQRLIQLRSQLEADKQMGLTPREKLALEAADDFIAERNVAQDALSDEIKHNARERLKQIWAGLGSSDDLPSEAAERGPGGAHD